MKILYDPQIFHWQAYGGISRYFYELLRYVDARPDVDMAVPLFHSYNAYIHAAPFAPHRRLVGPPARNLDQAGPISRTLERFKDKARIRLTWRNRAMAREAIAAGNYDLCHVTYYDPYFLDRIGDRPFVITVYDMIHELFPQMLDQAHIITHKALLAQKAARIIAISEQTKQDLVRICDIDPAKIDVVHLASSIDTTVIPPTRTGVRLPERYLLHVGDRWSYKNFQRLLRAAAPLLRADRSLSIVCAGSSPFNAEERALMDELGVSGQLVHIRIDNAILSQAYRDAIAFVFPSLYEGFGIPLLEAFSCDCPVASSNAGSLPEVAGDAARYFDPYDEDSIRDTLAQLIQDAELRADCVRRGRQRAQQFTWDRVGRETLNVYQRVLST